MQHLHDAETASAKLVLLYLEERGPMPPREIASDLDLTHLTALAILDTLDDRGLVNRKDDRIHLTNDS